MDLLKKLDLILFPPRPDPYRHLSWWQYCLFLVVGVTIFSSIGFAVPPVLPVGYDWIHFFGIGNREPFYPPWIVYVQYLTWPGLVGATFTGLAIALYQRKASPLNTVLAFLALPTLWVWHLGQLEGLIVLGLTGLPWLTPLALLKPQLSIFAFFASKKYLLGLLIWLVISVIIWGLWPIDMLNFSNLTQQMGVDNKVVVHEISLWPWSLPLALVLLWLSRSDMDLLVLAGTFATPHLHLYHYFIAVPALARVSWKLALLAVIISWLPPFLKVWVGPEMLFVGHLFPLLLWFGIYIKQRAEQRGSLQVRNLQPEKAYDTVAG